MQALAKAENKDPDPSRAYGPPKVDRIWGIWGSYHNIPKTIFYLLKGDYMSTEGTLRAATVRTPNATSAVPKVSNHLCV